MLKVLVVEDEASYVDELRAEVFGASPAPPVPCDVRYVASLDVALQVAARFRPDLVLLDQVFPRTVDGRPDRSAGGEVIDWLAEHHPTARIVALSSLDRDFAVRLLTSRRIADFVFKDVDWAELVVRLHGHLQAAADERRHALEDEEARARTAAGDGEFVAEDPASLRVLARVDAVAGTDATVLLLGESGTGKELLARRLHERSSRREASFVAVNCGALDEELVRSELFGHVRGAFTGATADHLGKFERAHGGTLFLDEVGELSLANQVRLLRVLEERVVERVGSSEPIECDVRLVAATNRDLTSMVGDGSFRDDLFYRLNVFAVTVPPLRDRPADVPPLARRFLRTLAGRMGRNVRDVDDGAMALLRQQRWPGNVRQLRNAVEAAVILERSDRLTAASLTSLAPSGPRGGAPWQPGLSYQQAMADGERRLLSAALAVCGGDTVRAADLLQMNLRTLQRRLKALALEAHAFRHEGAPGAGA